MTPDMATELGASQRRPEGAPEVHLTQEPTRAAPGPGGEPSEEPSLPLLPRGVCRAQRMAVGVGVGVALLGVAVLVSWSLGLPPLAPVPGPHRAVAIELAVAFLIAGLALVAAGLTDDTDGGLCAQRLRRSEVQRLRRLRQLGGGAVLLVGGLHLVRALEHVHVAVPGPTVSRPVVMALYFVAVGSSLLLLDHGRADEAATVRPAPPRAQPAAWLAYGAAWLGGLVLTGQLLSVPRLYALDMTTAASLLSSVAMVALALGILAARPRRGLTAVALSSTTGGALLRGLVPASLLIPPLGMWILVGLAPRLGLLEDRFATALATMAGGAIIAALAARLARRLTTSDSQRLAHQLWLRRDLPELVQALQERDRTRRDLERTSHDLDEFAYAASHDLRAPLRGIANLAQWVEEDLGEGVASTTRHQLNLLRGRVQRMEKLIDDILAYSRAGRSSAAPCPVAVAALLTETIAKLAPPPAARFDLAPDLPQLVTEREQLQQIFTHLLGNALKHGRRDDLHVRISAEDAGEFVCFSVADNGPGIAPQYHERIWGMFQTLASRDQVEGTGIGLATVKKLVERCGGHAGVDSAEGRGARFFFLWPRHMPPISST